MSNRLADVRDRRVQFRIADVYFPEPDEILQQLHGCDELQGKVVEVSEGATGEGAFVVVQVNELQQPLFVPFSKVRPEDAEGSNGKTDLT